MFGAKLIFVLNFVKSSYCNLPLGYWIFIKIGKSKSMNFKLLSKKVEFTEFFCVLLTQS